MNNLTSKNPKRKPKKKAITKLRDFLFTTLVFAIASPLCLVAIVAMTIFFFVGLILALLALVVVCYADALFDTDLSSDLLK